MHQNSYTELAGIAHDYQRTVTDSSAAQLLTS